MTTWRKSYRDLEVQGLVMSLVIAVGVLEFIGGYIGPGVSDGTNKFFMRDSTFLSSWE